MKRIKQLLTLLLAVLLVCSLTLPAFAVSGTNDNSGKITIDNAVVGQTYTIYQILALESYDTDKSSYSYKAATAWSSFVSSEAIKDVYLVTDTNGYVTWKKDADVAAFAKLAQAYAKTNSISDQGRTTAITATVEFTGLNLGYYLVDTTLGTLCSLDTTNPTVTIKEKNAAPTVEKKVQEDKDSSWGATNDADIGQTVNFMTTINVLDGNPKSYVLHDTMSSGLTFDTTSVVVTRNGTQLTAGTDYTLVSTGLTDGCTFEIRFTDVTASDGTVSSILKTNDTVVVTYSATLNKDAVVGLTGNPNKTFLKYKDTDNVEHSTAESETKTYTWDVDVLKYANGNKSTVLAGVKFVLLKKVNGTDTFAVVDSNGKITGWTTDGVKPETGADESKTYATVLTTNANGKIEIDGLDADTYYLREIEALPGYNILSGDEQFTITGATTPVGSDTPTYSALTVEVENKSGTELPSTGGMGTTLFYVIGGTLVLAAVVLLVTKKRMKAEG